MKGQVEKWDLLSNQEKIRYADVVIAMNNETLEGVNNVLAQVDKFPTLQSKYEHVYLDRTRLLEEIEWYEGEKKKILE